MCCSADQHWDESRKTFGSVRAPRPCGARACPLANERVVGGDIRQLIRIETSVGKKRWKPRLTGVLHGLPYPVVEQWQASGIVDGITWWQQQKQCPASKRLVLVLGTRLAGGIHE